MADMNVQPMPEDEDNYYTLVPEQGLCLLGDCIINLRKITLIKKDGDATKLYSGSNEPISLPGSVFEELKEAIFAIDDFDDDEEEEFELIEED